MARKPEKLQIIWTNILLDEKILVIVIFLDRNDTLRKKLMTSLRRFERWQKPKIARIDFLCTFAVENDYIGYKTFFAHKMCDV